VCVHVQTHLLFLIEETNDLCQKTGAAVVQTSMYASVKETGEKKHKNFGIFFFKKISHEFRDFVFCVSPHPHLP